MSKKILLRDYWNTLSPKLRNMFPKIGDLIEWDNKPSQSQRGALGYCISRNEGHPGQVIIY